MPGDRKDVCWNREDVAAVTSQDSQGRTPLSHAGEMGCKAIVKMLLEREDVTADSKDSKGRTPLSYAAEMGCKAIVKMLLEREDVAADSKDSKGRTPLSFAEEKGHDTIVKLLLGQEVLFIPNVIHHLYQYSPRVFPHITIAIIPSLLVLHILHLLLFNTMNQDFAELRQ